VSDGKTAAAARLGTSTTVLMIAVRSPVLGTTIVRRNT
jgi:hypothetical protein